MFRSSAWSGNCQERYGKEGDERNGGIAPKFCFRAKERDVIEKMGTHPFEMIIKSADYCFNKPHSLAYASITCDIHSISQRELPGGVFYGCMDLNYEPVR